MLKRILWRSLLVRRIPPIILLGVICVCAAYYYMGYFDFSFVDRSYILGDGLHEKSPHESSDTDTEAGNDSHGQSVTNMTEEELDDKYNETVMAAEVNFLSTEEYSLLGYTLTDSVYSPDTHVIGRITPHIKFAANYSIRLKDVTYPVKSYEDTDREYVITYETKQVQRPLIELYMGCIFYDNGEDFWIISADGEPVCTFDLNEYVPALTRDVNGNPVFKSESDGRTAYYILSEDKKSMLNSDYNDTTDNRGIYADYPSYYGKSASVVLSGTPSVVPGKTYNSTAGTWTYSGIGGVYNAAFNFSEGYAVAANDKNEVTVLTSSGRPAFLTKEILRNNVNRNVYELRLCVMPASFGIESMGHFYFDHGLVRVREQRLEYYDYLYRNRKTVIYDIEKAYRTDGTEFPIPYSYNIISYSNGVFLLEKENKFGFMDYTGAWIAQPVYTEASTFSEGLATLTLSNGKMGMIDTAGNIVIPFRYDYISSVSSGIIAAYSESGGWSLFQKMQTEHAFNTGS